MSDPTTTRGAEIINSESFGAASAGVAQAGAADSVDTAEQQPGLFEVYRWLLYSVGFGLVPILGVLFRGLTSTKGGFNLGDALGTGELFLISTVIAGGVLGDLRSRGPQDSGRSRSARYINEAAFFCVVLSVVANSFAYIQVDAMPKWETADLSCWFFAFTIAVSVICLIMAKPE